VYVCWLFRIELLLSCSSSINPWRNNSNKEFNVVKKSKAKTKYWRILKSLQKQARLGMKLMSGLRYDSGG
jgi:hypothetical protein